MIRTVPGTGIYLCSRRFQDLDSIYIKDGSRIFIHLFIGRIPDLDSESIYSQTELGSKTLKKIFEDAKLIDLNELYS